MKVTILGIDLAKNVFRLHGVDAEGRPVLRKQLRRAQLLPFMRQLTPCLVGLEPCHSAHYWGRELEKLGHAVRLMNPRFIKPYLKGEKNDANDAAAICEAVSRPSMRFVPVKNPAQQDIQALHRVREQLIRNRTALVNQARGLLGENGIVVAQGIGRLRQALPSLLEDPDNRLSGLFREMLGEMAERLRWLDDRCRRYEQRRTTLSHRRTSTAAGADRGSGSVRRHRIARRGWQRTRVQERSRTGRLAWVGTASAFERRPQRPTRDKQTRRSLSAHSAHPWSALGLARR
jgi:transposase